jgi:hypothetical protein
MPTCRGVDLGKAQTVTKDAEPRTGQIVRTPRTVQFKIVYTLGKDNGRADALSRRHGIAGIKIFEVMSIQTSRDT